MVGSRLLRPVFRLLPNTQPLTAPRNFPSSYRSAFQPQVSTPVTTHRRRYATPSGVKEVAVRDALNEALAEELETNDKVFVLGEEVAQYNGA